MDLAELTKMYDFTGRTIVLTGGAGILGGEIACALVGCGANVALLDREPALADALRGRFRVVLERNRQAQSFTHHLRKGHIPPASEVRWVNDHARTVLNGSGAANPQRRQFCPLWELPL